MVARPTNLPRPTLGGPIGHPLLGVVLDLDGTLIPHAGTPADARVDDEGRALLAALARCPETRVAVVSGRRREELDEMLGGVERLFLVAEHGAWRRPHGAAWEPMPLEGASPEPIADVLRDACGAFEGAAVEQKRWGACVHFRRVAEDEREALLVAALAEIEAWIAAHPEYELLEGSCVLEVRHREANKGAAVRWLRARLPAGTRLVAIGDDATDEDAFAALGEDDAAIRVGERARPTHAGCALPDVSSVRTFLREVAHVRSTQRAGASGDARTIAPALRARLLVISNRVPEARPHDETSSRKRAVGGLVSGLVPALESRGGVWLGWSGASGGAADVISVPDAAPRLATFDLPPGLRAGFYDGFANRALWPILHGLPGRARCEDDDFRAYRLANEIFAEHGSSLAERDGVVWVHDYHLLFAAEGLRRRGHAGPIGLFLHVPFPAIDLFETLPPAAELLRGLLAYDLVGVHTRRYAENLTRAAIELAGARSTETGVRIGSHECRVGVFPLGVDAAAIRADAARASGAPHGLSDALRGRKLVLGVDRLDYSKGIVERLEAFDRFLAVRPEWKRRVVLLQVAVPSREDVPEYAAQRRAIEALVGAINGRHGEADWVPVRYVYRSYAPDTLAGLYRAADVALVTPLRDGMNLVAKEYVAAQDDTAPGVLVLSRFAGAAHDLDAAVLVNPHDRSAVAAALAQALEMPEAERSARHAVLRARVQQHAPEEWANGFLRELECTRG